MDTMSFDPIVEQLECVKPVEELEHPATLLPAPFWSNLSLLTSLLKKRGAATSLTSKSKALLRRPVKDFYEKTTTKPLKPNCELIFHLSLSLFRYHSAQNLPRERHRKRWKEIGPPQTPIHHRHRRSIRLLKQKEID